MGGGLNLENPASEYGHACVYKIVSSYRVDSVVRELIVHFVRSACVSERRTWNYIVEKRIRVSGRSPLVKTMALGRKKSTPPPVRNTQYFTTFGMRRRSEKSINTVNVFYFVGALSTVCKENKRQQFRYINRRTVKNFFFFNS